MLRSIDTTLWKRRLSLGLLALLPLLGTGTGCQSTFLPDSFLREQGIAQFQQMKEQAEVSDNFAHNRRVQRIMDRMVPLVEGLVPDAEWEAVVFEEDSINAFALPGGKIGIHTGLIEVSDDDQLAAVVAHEMVHVIEKHANQRLSRALIQAGLGVVAGAAASQQDEVDPSLILAAYGLGSQLTMLHYSRDDELEADRKGLLLMAQAGYDPEAAVRFWEAMQAMGGDAPPEFLSTHPGHANRTERLRALVPEAREVARGLRPGPYED